MQKRMVLFTFSLLFLFAFLQTANVQSKEMTADEYMSAYYGALAATNRMFPRIETYIVKSGEFSESLSRKSVESKRRSYSLTKITSNNITNLKENVEYDGEKFERFDKGIWQRPAPPIYGMMSDRGSEETNYRVEEIIVSGKKIKLYTETIKKSGNRTYVNWARIDSEGKMLEYGKKYSSEIHMIYDFPETAPLIKKPILGSNKDI